MKKVLLFFSIIVCCASSPLPGSAQESKGPQKNSEAKADMPCFGDPVIGGNTDYEVVKQNPKAGIKIEGYPKSLNSGSNPSRLDTVYRVIFDEVKYIVYVSPEETISTVQTRDANFKTPEGIKIGDPLKKVLDTAKADPVRVAECYYYVSLKSGWKALFGRKFITEDGQLLPEAVVTQFVLRD
jgi:hypothetical protein